MTENPRTTSKTAIRSRGADGTLLVWLVCSLNPMRYEIDLIKAVTLPNMMGSVA